MAFKMRAGKYSPMKKNFPSAFKQADDSQDSLNKLLNKRKTLKKGSNEWKINQNKINELLGDPTKHDVDVTIDPSRIGFRGREATAENPYHPETLKEYGAKGEHDVGIFRPITPDYVYKPEDFGRGGKPIKEWKKHTEEELKQIIKDSPHRFGGFDPKKDAKRMNEILRPSKKTFADKFGKWKKSVRYDYGDDVRMHGFSEEEKESMRGRQKKRRDWHQSYKDQYIKGTGDKKPSAVKPIEFPKEAFHPPKAQTWTNKFGGPLKKSPLKFGRKHKK